jgi:putative colanic acid biosynthesis acetyltransferase WcaF
MTTAQTTSPARTAPQKYDFLRQTLRERWAAIMWGLFWHSVFRWSPSGLHGWRRFLLRLFRARIDPTVLISPSVRVLFPWNLTLGPYVNIQPRTILNCMGRISIGRGTLVSRYAHMCAGTHEYQRPDMRIERCPIEIGQNVWIATDAFVGPGVKIGDGCLLAARSSAFHDLPSGMVCIGEPAEPRHVRFQEQPADEQGD